MAWLNDGTFRLFWVARFDVAEPDSDTLEPTPEMPLPALKDMLLHPEFIRLEYVVDTVKTTITCEDYPADSDAARAREDWESEAALRDAESGAAYERYLDAQAAAESPLEAARERWLEADFEARLRRMPLPTTPADDENGIPF